MEIKNYINEFVSNINDNNSIDKVKTLKQNLKKDVILGIIIWIAGSTVVGIPLVYGIIGYRGVCLGYTLSSFIAVLGVRKGILIDLCGLFVHNIVFIPSIILISASGMNLYRKIVKEKRRDNIKFEIFKHSVKSIIGVFGIILADLIQILFSTNMLIYFVKYI